MAAGDWSPPDELDEYRVVRLLGAGAIGRVYLAEDLLLKRPVAIKFLQREPDAGQREQFFVEARAAARLSHPNVVAIHRVGELGRRPYLVSEYVRGTPLDRLDRPVPAQQLRRIAIGLLRGLGAAHRRGVLHRDLKPANAILDADDEIKLLDFGMALLVDRGPEPGGGGLAGSPRYLAPELWRGEAPSRQSDLYALGVLLYELASGAPPFAGDDVATLRAALAAGPAPPLATRADGLPAALATAVDRCLQADPAARFASADACRDALEAPPAAVGHALMSPAGGNPYRGLRHFDAAHRELFFGRGAETRALVERLRAESFVLVVGDSGVGKSSLCAAGVVPLWAEQTGAPAATMAPGRHPLETLCQLLAPRLGRTAAELAAAVRMEPAALSQVLRSGGPQLLFLDQLEELLTVAAPAEAALLATALATALARAPGLRLVATARSDFLSRLATLPGLGEEMSRAVHLVRPLSGDGMREAIVGPARSRGVRFESEALVDAIIAAAHGGLPLVQFALSEAWSARDVAGAVISAATVEAIGGVGGALARHADRVLAQLLPAERAAARRLLLALVTPDGTRARASAAELGTDSDRAGRAALEALVRGRLVLAGEDGDGAPGGDDGGGAFGGDDGGGAYQLAHDSLIGGWDTLRDWRAGDSERRAARGRLVRAAAEWERLGRAPDALYGRRQLTEVAALAGHAAARSGRRGAPAGEPRLRDAGAAPPGDSGGAAPPGESTSASRPGNFGASQPNSASASRPGNFGASQPDSASASRPGNFGASQPNSASASRPGNFGASQPNSASASRPDNSGASQPDSASAARPGNFGASQPDSASASRPGNSGASQPDSAGTTRPGNFGASQPDSVGASRPGEGALDGTLGPRERAFVAASRRALRRRAAARLALAIGLPLALLATLLAVRSRSRREIEATIAARSGDADRALAAGRASGLGADRERRVAFAAFDAQDWPDGEQAWSRALALAQQTDAHWAAATAALEGGLALAPERADLRRRLGDLLYARIVAGEELHPRATATELRARLAAYDLGGERQRALAAPARLVVQAQPGEARVSVARYEERDGRLALGPATPVGSALELSPGSYLLAFSAPGYAPVRLPLLAHRDERLTLRVALPPVESVPAGYVYVPAGRFLFGSDDPEELRRGFLKTVPLHEVTTAAYLIARHEVTFADWIAYLEALPPDERRRRIPVAESERNALSLAPLADGSWQLSLRPTNHTYVARLGEPIRYLDRQRRAVQDWSRMPVAAVSYDDGIAYAGWLAASGRLPGARMCDDHEWERAARGADGRTFPGGATLGADDANHDVTYGRRPLGFGPDEVGEHPASRSPFGVDDLSGNVWEWVRSVARPDEVVYRGGSWYLGELSGRAANREVGERTTRHPFHGLRICATPRP